MGEVTLLIANLMLRQKFRQVANGKRDVVGGTWRVVSGAGRVLRQL
ncbi:hypothetical protein ACPC54_28690 [Kitasatospora sp. NPDC094028]